MFPSIASDSGTRLASVTLSVVVLLSVVAGAAVTAGAQPAGPGPRQVSDCLTVAEPGVYELDSDLTAGGGPCLRIRSSDVTLRGNGHAIDATVGSTAPVVLADGDLTNVTVTGLSVDAAPRPVLRFDGVTNGTVADLDISLVDPSSPAGAVAVTGDDNALRNVSGTRIRVAGDGNRIVDGSALGTEYTGVAVTGDDNALRNVTSQGRPALLLRGDGNEVRAGTYDGVADGNGVTVVNGSGTVLANATLRGGSADGAGAAFVDSDDATITGNSFRGAVATGLSIEASDGADVVGNRFVADLLFGARLIDGTNNTLRRNAFRAPVYLGEDAGGNLIYDNRLNASRDVFDRNVLFGPIVGDGDGPAANGWNVSARPGENVVGGDTVAGNYYASPDGTGFSQTCTDADADGICDSPNELAANNTDSLPLADPADGTAAPVDGNDTSDGDADVGEGANATNYQIDFVAGRPIENLSADRLYADEDRLLRFAFGEAGEGITDRGSAWPTERIRECVDDGHIAERDDGTASVTFAVAEGCEDVTLSLVIYAMPGETFDVDTVDQQELLNSTTGSFGPGDHTLTVDLPAGRTEG